MMNASVKNARLDVEPIQTSGESDSFDSHVPCSASPLPHVDSNITLIECQDKNQQYAMNGGIFQQAKERVSVPEAARRLGFEPDRAGKIRCPFHPGDDTASLQLYPDHWKCYGCGEHGDAVDLVSKYRNIPAKEAAAWLLGESALSPVTTPKQKAAPDYGVFEREHVYPNGTKKVVYRRKDGSKYAGWYHMDGGQWSKGRGDAPHILYEMGKPSDTAYIVEGEKDADNLSLLFNGFYVVSGENGAGHGKWLPEYTEQLKAAGVHTAVIFSDNDEPGRAYAEETAAALYGVVKRVQVLDLRQVWEDMPEKADVSDLIARFGGETALDLLFKLNENTPEWTPPEPEDKPQTVEDEKRTTRRMETRIEQLKAAVSEADAMKANGADAGDILKMLNQRTRVLKPLLTQAELEKILSGKLEARYNVISHRLEFIGARELFPKLKAADYADKIPVKLRDLLFEQYKGASANDIKILLGVIAVENSFNPVLDLLSKTRWDGVKRFPALCDALGITQDRFSVTLVWKWCLQSIALLHNDLESRNYSADGVLTFQGKQGIGKTSFGRCLSIKPQWFKDGATISERDKDTVIQNTAYWICELGEVERTFRAADIETLKQYLTRGFDEYRIPYGTESQQQPRRTSYFATCNSEEFLVDKTGNRRFWVVPLTEINLDALEAFNDLQFWREVYECWKHEETVGRGGKCYRLTSEERDKLDERNENYEKPMNGQSEVESILAVAKKSPHLYEWQWTTVSDWMTVHPVFQDRHLSSKTVGAVLNALKVQKSNRRVNGKATPSARYLPFPNRQG